MNGENRDYLIQLAEKNGLDVFAITHRTASNLQSIDNNESTAFDILLVNKRIEDSIELACKMVRNMILLERDDEAKRAIQEGFWRFWLSLFENSDLTYKSDIFLNPTAQKLVDAGAMSVKNNENFLLIKAHLEALDIFFEWSRLEQEKPRNAEKPDVNATRSFMKVIHFSLEF